MAAQTQRPAELVICDDGSSDNTLTIAQDFATNAPFPVRIERNAVNLGYSDNFLKAARLCKGDWIAFCDQDDIWCAKKLQRVASAIGPRPGAVLAVHRAQVVDENLRPIGKTTPRLPRGALIPPLRQPLWFKVPGFCCTFSRRLLPHIDRFRDLPNFFRAEKRMTHDKLVVWLAGIFGETLVLNENLALYRRHGGTVTELALDRTRGNALAVQEYNRHRAEVAEIYAQTLWAVGQKKGIDSGTLQRMTAAARHFERVSELYAHRAALPEARGFARVASVFHLAGKGAYAGTRPGFGMKGLVSDLFRRPIDNTAEGP